MNWILRLVLLCAVNLAVSACTGQDEDAAPPTPHGEYVPPIAAAATAIPTAVQPRPTRTPRPLSIQTPVRMFEVKPTPTPEVVVADDSYVEIANDEYYNAFPGPGQAGRRHARDRLPQG